MHASSNGSVAGWTANGSSAITAAIPGRQVPASVFLLNHIERLSRELGRADSVLEDLSSRADTLERRLLALERGTPLDSPSLADEERIHVELPELSPPHLATPAAPSGLVNLLSRLESLGQQVGRTESELDFAREEPEAVPMPTTPAAEVLVQPPAPDDILVDSPAVVATRERVVVDVPAVAMVVARRAADGEAPDLTGEGRAAFAAALGPPPGAVIRPISLGPAPVDLGPPLQIPASEIFAPSEVHRAFPVRVEADDDEEPLPATIVPLRRRHRLLLTAAVLIVAIFIALAGAIALTRAADDDEPTQATATTTGAALASVPPAAATLQPVSDGVARLPGIYALIAGSTAGASGPTGLVGSTRAEVEQLLGQPTETRSDGTVAYLNGSAVVSYSGDGRALRVVFDFSTPGDELDEAGAERVVALYRPADAQEVQRESPAPGVNRVVYTSAELASVFAGDDTAGRDSGSYLEEIHADSTGQVSTIILALGTTP